MSKFQIDLTNYPGLKHLFDNDKNQFGSIMKQAMTHLNDAEVNKRFVHANEIYKMEYLDMVDDIMDTFFNMYGIIDQHHNEGEKIGLHGLGKDLHPLAIFTNNAPVYNAKGESTTPAEWIQQDRFNLKDWLNALLYGARFVSWPELAEYISLGQYELIDVLKVRNFPQLAQYQPALDWQERCSIPKGKLIPGTGLFDGGPKTTKKLKKCPACNSDWNIEHENYAFCPECRLGGLK